MKANRKVIDADDAVSPVIAVILMVAITVVLAATVYLWVSGFGSNQRSLVNASFGAKSIDLAWANADTDTADDAVELTLASADSDVPLTDIAMSVDGTLLTWNNPTTPTSGTSYTPAGAAPAANTFCTTIPGGSAASGNWARGASVILVKPSGTGTPANTCGGTITAMTELASIKGIHSLKVTVKGQVVLDTSVEVHDAANA